MSPPATVVLDNEAVQALLDVSHPKHKRLLSFLDELNQRGRRRTARTEILVPVAVRVEAGWGRTEPASAQANRISRARDVILDSVAADRAVHLRREAAVSVVDATIGHVARTAALPVVILTSDVSDMQLLAQPRSGIRVIRI